MTVAVRAPRLAGDTPAASSPQALADRRELALVAVERAGMPIAVTDPRQPDNPLVLANRAFLEQSGYRAEEVVGRNCRFMQGPDTDPAAIAEMRDAVAQGRGSTVELLNYRRDGSSFWAEIQLSPVRDEDGELLYFFAAQRDLTAIRRAEALAASETRLLREVDHRTRNALALVQSIVRLTRADDAKGYARAVERRVDALARSHTLLADAGWVALPVSSVIAAETAKFPAQVSTSGPDTLVPAARVQPLGLLLHELLTNAVRHGALSVDEGRLHIDWRAEDDGRRIVIELNETGGPAPAAAPPPGVGSKIVRTLAKRQLNGRAEFDWQPDGLRSRVDVRVA